MTGTFLVAAAEEGLGVLASVGDGQVRPLAENPGFEAGEVIEATRRIAAGPGARRVEVSGADGVVAVRYLD